jgi:hypothetical protein
VAKDTDIEIFVTLEDFSRVIGIATGVENR